MRGPASLLAIGLLTVSASTQEPEPPRFRVGVDLVRIDAVVTDGDGRIVDGLTADDFILEQDGTPQPIVAAQYVAVERQAAPLASRAPGALPVGLPAPPRSGGPLRAASVQRTMAVVVDDLGIAWENMESTRRALRRFVNEEVQDGDLVAVLRTGASVSALQQFTTDKRRLFAAVDQLRWNGFSRREVTSFRARNDYRDTGGDYSFEEPDPDSQQPLDALRERMSAAGTLGSLTLTIQGMRDLPGRKAVVLVSEGFRLMEFIREGSGSEVFQPEGRVHLGLRGLIDQALRAGVVIYALDPRGLATGGLVAEDNMKSLGVSATAGAGIDRRRELLETQDVVASIAEETGGLAMLNRNDLADSLRRISDDQRGYYVLGYAPPEGTFAEPGRTPRYHRVSVKVRRPGLKVRTRKGFLGVSDADVSAAQPDNDRELYRTAVSPFAATDIPLRVTTLAGYSAEGKPLVRALLHLDGRALTFVEGDKGPEATLDVLALLFDESGTALVGKTAAFAIGRPAGARNEVPEGDPGLMYSLTVPVPRAGGYQVRFAVRDQASGSLGAAGQFVELADVSRGALALSGVVLGEEIDGTRDGIVLADGESRTARASNPVLRRFEPGARLVYTCEIYNAEAPLETRISVWRDGRIVFSAPPSRLTVPAGAKKAPLTAAGGIQLGRDMTPGRYLFQLAVNGGRKRAAVQWVDFEVGP